ncbi:MAG: SapC family protein [Lamprobacter sp.]|uniref:SapC family protein n=1 Tax=Lamprobacter sp. TaxID=3100796 RepID=UPI002B25B73F|nr:SapC family protein [Lamprobacter sp.]MEA3642607.1 SapC family protein [Lamprobacter sp.]
MPHYQPITHTDFAHRRWKPFDHDRFAATEAIVPLVAQELAKACHSLPIAFIRQQDYFIPAAVQGLQPGQNLFVAPDGRWLGGYIPAAYRGYPFALAQADNDQLVLCVDDDSGLLIDDPDSDEGEPFFDADGQPAEAVRQVLDFLEKVAADRQRTERLCALLAEHALIQPWPLTVKTADGERPVQGLHRIDEAALSALPTVPFETLRQAGALPLIYCQLLSMQHIALLGKLAEYHAKLADHHAKAQPALDAHVFFGTEDSLSFDWDA